MSPMSLGLEGMSLGGDIGRAGGGEQYWINLSPATTTKIKAGFDAMQAGTRNMNIAWTGSSVDRGVDETAVPYNSQYPLSVAEQQAILFRAEGIASGANNWYGISGNNFADYMARDSRCASTGSATSGVTSVPCQGGSELEFPTAAGTFSFTPQQNTNTADIYYQDSIAGRSFTWSVDGGAPTTITTTGLNTIVKATIPLGSVGAHTIQLAWSAGFIRIYGIDCYDSTRKEITVRQWATSGGTISGMIDNTGAPSSGRLRQIQLFPPDVIMGDIGVVNTWRAVGVSVATAKAQAETYIDAIKAAGADFIFVVPPFDSGSVGNTANQQAYIDAIVASCISKGCAVFNLRAAPGWTSKAASDAAGYTVAGDAVHKTIAGQANTAELLLPGLFYAMERETPLVMAAATRFLGLWNNPLAPAGREYQLVNLSFGTPDFVTRKYRFFFPAFRDAGGVESAASNAYVVDGFSLKVGGVWYDGPGFTVDPAVDDCGYLTPPLYTGDIPPNSTLEFRAVMHVNAGQRFLGGIHLMTQNGEAQEGTDAAGAAALIAKLTNGAAVTNNSGIVNGSHFSPGYAVAEGWDGATEARRVYCVIGDSLSWGSDDSALLADARGVFGWIARGLDDNVSSVRHPFLNISNSGDSMGVMQLQSGWGRRLRSIQKCPNVPFTHIIDALGQNDVALSDYLTVMRPKQTTFSTLLASKWPGKPRIKVELPPRAQSTANAFADLAGQSFSSEAQQWFADFTGHPNACRWLFNADVGLDGTANAGTYFRANGYIEDSFSYWPELSYDTGANRDKWALRSFSALLTSQYNGASATTFVMDTAPAIGEEIVINPTNANRLYTKVLSVTGAGPFTVTVDAGNTTTYAIGVAVRAALPSSNGAVHFGPMAHMLAAQAVIDWKNARPLT